MTVASPRARTASPRTRVAPSRPTLVDDPHLDPMLVGPDRSPKEKLLQLKTRLEALYRALGRESPR